MVDTRAGMSWCILELACRGGYHSWHVVVYTRAGMSCWILGVFNCLRNTSEISRANKIELRRSF